MGVPMKLIFTPVLLLLTLSSTAPAEVFVLAGGGRVVGEWINRDDSPREKYIVQAADGAKITLDPEAVQEILKPRPEEAEYERIRPTYADTAAAQWELAQWCREHKLKAQRETHLRRVIELDPNHVEARHALGYSQVEGQWTTPKEVMTKQGYVRRNGKWMTAQEIEVENKKQEQKAAQLKWLNDIKRWRGWLGGVRDDKARENIRAIDNPDAVKGLAVGMHDEDRSEVRKMLAAALSRVDTNEAALTLAYYAIFDEVDDVRETCLDHLSTKKRPDVIAYFVLKLRDKDNLIVNRAGICLGRMKDPSAIGPLIDALITVHKFKISKPGGDNAMSASFGSGGTGMSMGAKPTILRREIPNQAVLDALVALTGRNYVFDKQAWKAWYAGQKKAPERIDARRG
jgi:hypothetical protein